MSNRRLKIPASSVSSFLNLHRFRSRFESYANLIERRFPNSMKYYMTPSEITTRNELQYQKRISEKTYWDDL